MMKHEIFKAILVFGSAFCIMTSAFSCGYKASGKQVNLPPEIKKIAVVTFRNDTTEAGVEEIFTEAIIHELAKDKRLKITTAKDADAILTGRVLKIKLEAISFDDDGYASGYRVSVEVELVLGSKGNVIWSSGVISDSEEFNTSEDLLGNEVYRRDAIGEVAEDLMEDAHDNMLEMF